MEIYLIQFGLTQKIIFSHHYGPGLNIFLVPDTSVMFFMSNYGAKNLRRGEKLSSRFVSGLKFELEKENIDFYPEKVK